MDDAEWIEVGKTTETDGKTYRWLMCPHCGQVKLAEMESKTIERLRGEEDGGAE